MEPLTAILIEDEINSLNSLRLKLSEFCPDVKVVGTAQHPAEAILLIRLHKPDVIFLDIELPGMNGFRLLEELGPDLNFEIIFTTAYNQYAIDAIRFSAFDYLVKPIGVPDLVAAAERLVKERKKQTQGRFDILRQSMQKEKSDDDKIALPTQTSIEFLAIKNIVRIESSANYCVVKLVNGHSILVTRLLKDFEEMLLPYRFYRVHHSHLINLNYIDKYIRGDGGQAVLSNGDVIIVSKRKKEEFLKLLMGKSR